MTTDPAPGAGPVAPRPSVVVVGAGNIGSFAIGLLARLPWLGRLIIVDPDVYEARNVWGQDMSPGDVGRGKAETQALRARLLNPALAVEAIGAAVEDVPRGRLRADLILACVDSRRARLAINHIAWRLGIPFVDAGVAPEHALVRVEAYAPLPDRACLVCAYSDDDFAALEQAYACRGEDTAAAAPSDAPALLGAAAAALQVGEAEKLLRGRRDEALLGRQVVMDLRAHRHFVTALRRSSRCRFDHRTPRIERVPATPAQLTLGQVLALAPVVRGVHGELRLSVEGHAFLVEVRCPACGTARSIHFRLSGRLRPDDAVCANCNRRRVATGFDRVESLSALLPESQLARPLSSLGLRPGDVVTLSTDEAESHFELGGDPAASPGE